MALQKIPFSWSIQGGLDTKKCQFSIQPGSMLTLDNVVQERANEWRRRNGFTQVAADTVGSSLGAFYLAKIGDAGMVASGQNGSSGAQQLKKFTPAGGWTVNGQYGASAPPDCLTSKRVIDGDSTVIGFATTGTLRILATLGTTASIVTSDETAGPVTVTSLALGYSGFTALRVRCAATSTRLVAFVADDAGNLRTYIYDGTTGAFLSGPTTIKTGLHLTQPYLDVMWYGGATITVVARTAADAVRFIEFNPATGALATDTTIAGVSCANCLALLADTGASGTRFVATSHTTPTTRVVRCSSAGAVLTDDQVEAVASTQIAGVAWNAGASWNVVYRTTTPAVRTGNKTGGVVSTAGYSSFLPELYIDSMAWAEPYVSTTDGLMNVILGVHSGSLTDPLDTWYIQQFNLGNTTVGGPQYAITPLQAAAALSVNASLYQVTRTAARLFKFALPVLLHYSAEGASTRRDYSLTAFTQRFVDTDDIGSQTYPCGSPVSYRDTAFFPGARLSFVSLSPVTGVGLVPVGTIAPPTAPVLSLSGGGSLTPLATYGYCAFIESISAEGDLWRSPPSVPTIVTLTGVNQSVNVSVKVPAQEPLFRFFNVVLCRTLANGSVYRRLATQRVILGANNVFTLDGVADSVLDDGELLYTGGETSTAITPAASHVFIHDDRLWLINRDFRSELSYSKNLRPGRQPEFTDENVIDIDDEFGDLTNGCSVEGRGIVFKRNAIYFVQGDGFTDSGSGENYRTTRVSQDIGSLPGSPIVVAGDTVYFVSERGIYSINTQAQLEFAGAGVDQYLNQPLVQTSETVYDGCFVPDKDEVRFVTTNYVLVFSRTFGTWTRWTGLAGMKRCLVINGKMVLFKGSDGTIWREGDETQLTDQGVAFTGVIRSPWLRLGADGTTKATPAQQGMRLYRARAIMSRTAGGGNATLIGKIYTDNSDTSPETFTSGLIAGATLTPTGEMHPLKQKCTSFSVELTLPSGDVSVRLEGFSAVVGIRSAGELRLAAGNKWS